MFFRLLFNRNISILKYLVVVVLTTSVGTHANAEVWIEQLESMRFPSSLGISNGNARIEVLPSGTIGGATNADVLGTLFNAGEFQISSNTNSTITIDIDSNDDVTGVTLKSFSLSYQGTTYSKFPARRLPSPGNGAVARLGIRAVYTSSATEGIHLPSFSIVVTEDNP